MHKRAAWVIVLVTASVAWAAPAGAAQVGGALQVTEVTATEVTFAATTQRTCAADEQCDYFSELVQLDGDGPCPAAYPDDPWITWSSGVLNTASTDTATITPRRWPSKTAISPQRLCLYTNADYAYYLVAGTTVTRPAIPADPAPAAPGLPTPAAPKPAAPDSPDAPAPTVSGSSTSELTCAGYVYQQTAQKALDADPSLAARLDRNRNGTACQDLPKRKTYVQTLGKAASATSARAALRHAYGKAFAQGTGYRSRCDRVSRIRVRCTVSWKYKGTWAGHVDVAAAIRGNRQAVLTRVSVRRP